MEVVNNTMLRLLEMQPYHYQAVKDIYELGIATQMATLETKAPAWDDWDKDHLAAGRVVAMDDDRVVGWAALSPVTGRCVYSGVAENSVYIHPEYKGKGVGVLLLTELIKRSEQAGIWTLQAHMLAENIASRKLHLKCGFRIVGIREGLGQLHGIWKDTYLLERRSKVVGI